MFSLAARRPQCIIHCVFPLVPFDSQMRWKFPHVRLDGRTSADLSTVWISARTRRWVMSWTRSLNGEEEAGPVQSWFSSACQTGVWTSDSHIVISQQVFFTHGGCSSASSTSFTVCGRKFLAGFGNITRSFGSLTQQLVVVTDRLCRHHFSAFHRLKGISQTHVPIWEADRRSCC